MKKKIIFVNFFVLWFSIFLNAADTTKAGYQGGQSIPSGDQIVDLEQSYNIHGNDGIDDSVALQQAINDHKNSGHIVVLLLPSGQIDISGPSITYKDGTGIDGGGIYIDGDGIVIRGRGIDPVTGTRIVYNHPEDIYSVSGNIPVIDGKIWPGLAVFQVETREISSGYEEYPGSVNFHWKLGKKLRSLFQPGTNGSYNLYLNKASDADAFSVGQTVWMAACNTLSFLTNHFSPSIYWQNDNYLARNQMFHITAIHKNGNDDTYVTLDEPLEFDVPYSDNGEIYGSTKYSKIVPVHLIRNVGFEDFTFYHSLEGTEYSSLNGRPYDASTNPNGVGFRYVNMAPKQAIHTILFKYCEDVWVKNVKVEMSGSHPIVTEVVQHGTFKDNILLGSWNKGKGGMGYFRGSKAFECLFENNFLSMVRHLAFQWSATGNVSRYNIFWHAGDMNFHAGWERYNLVEHIWSELLYEHQSWNDSGTAPEGGTWYPLWWGAAPHGSKWAGVGSGPHNVVKNSVFYKQRSSGGNIEKWGMYDTPGISYIFGWDGTEWRHLNTDGNADGDNIIQTWEDNQLYDFTAPGKGVFTAGAAFIDVTPPTLTITTPTNYARFTNNFYIQGSANDDVACKIMVSVDNGTNEIAWGMVYWREPIYITNLNNGLHHAIVTAIDGENNITKKTLYFYVGPEQHSALSIDNIVVYQTNNGTGLTFIHYKGSASNDSFCFYKLAEYSTNHVDWFPMTLIKTDSRSTPEPLNFTFSGTNISLVWDTKSDIGNIYDDTVWIKLQVTNAVTNSDIVTNGPFSIDTIAPSLVLLVSPTSNSIVGVANYSFEWTSTTDLGSGVDKYIFEIDNNSNFNSIEYTKTTNGTNFFVTSLTNGTYYWRVRAYDIFGNINAWSSVWNVTIDSNQIIPILYSPTNNTISSDRTPIFIWSQESGISSNQIVITTNGTIATNITLASNETNYQVSFALPEGTNSWMVRVYKINIGWQVFSASYTYIVDTIAPGNVSNLTPIDKAVVVTNNVTLSWSSAADANGVAGYNVVINGTTNYVTDTNITMNLSEGLYTWKVSAVDKAGNVGNYTNFHFTVKIEQTSGSKNNEFSVTPNPLFQNETMDITYGAKSDNVKFEVYTIVGSLVKTIKPNLSTQTAIWDGKNDNGKEVASGIYLMIMRVDGKMVYHPIKIGYIGINSN